MRLELPEHEVMRQVGSCAQLWSRLNNDQNYVFESYAAAATGVQLRLYGNESPDDWGVAQRVIDALEHSVRLAGQLLPADPSARDAYALQDWLKTIGPASRYEPERRTLARMLIYLGNHLAGFNDRNDGRIDDLVRVVPMRENEDITFSRTEFDAFVSYTHRRAAGMAQELHDALGRRGVTSWLDRGELRLTDAERLAPGVLKRRLRHALAACRHTVFFEMQMEATVDEDFRGRRTAFLWQEFEHRYARDLIYVRPSTRRVELRSGQSVEWRDIDQLAAMLVDHFRNAPTPGAPPEPGPYGGEEPDPAEASATLSALASEHFGRPLEIAPMAALALLAPGDEDEIAYGDDILINLLRYDPVAALLLAEAGVDLAKLFAVGVKVNRRRWAAPHRHLLGDVFGDATPAPERGRLGTGDVLQALVRGAQADYAQRTLIDRTLRWMRPRERDEDRRRRLDALLEALLERLQREGGALGRHGWLLTQAGAGWRADPVMVCGSVVATAEDGPAPAAVLQRQSTRLFPAQLATVLGEALVTGDATWENRHPEVALTWTGTYVASNVARISAEGSEAWTELFGLDGAVELDTADLERCLAVAAQRRPAPLRGPRNPVPWRPALLRVAEPLDAHPPGEPLDVLALTLSVAAPLQAHADVRDLEYDDV